VSAQLIFNQPTSTAGGGHGGRRPGPSELRGWHKATAAAAAAAAVCRPVIGLLAARAAGTCGR